MSFVDLFYLGHTGSTSTTTQVTPDYSARCYCASMQVAQASAIYHSEGRSTDDVVLLFGRQCQGTHLL